MSERQLLRLVASQLKVGAPLPFGVRDEAGKLLLARGQVVSGDMQLETLLARGLYVDIEEVRALKEGRAAAEVEAQKKTLFDLWEQAHGRLDRLLKSLAAVPGFAARCETFAQQLMQLVQRDVDIAIYLSMRQDERRAHLYGLTHSIHTALIVQLLGNRMGWDEPRVRRLVKAALTMNLSIVELQGRFAVMGRLSDAQREQIRAHPMQAVQALRDVGVDDEAWLQAVAEHHEMTGGSGYPAGVAQPCEDAFALRMADVFMAKISPRQARPALPIQEAAKQMFQESGGSPMAAAIVKEYGLYPPGDFVRLASGEQAVVVRRGASATTPMAAAITDAKGMPMVNTIRRDTALPTYAIQGPVRDRSLVIRVPPERLFGLAE